MTLKIEPTPQPIRPKSKKNNVLLHEFILTLKVMKVGQSCVLPDCHASNYRQAISIVQTLLGTQYSSRVEGKNLRVARIQ